MKKLFTFSAALAFVGTPVFAQDSEGAESSVSKKIQCTSFYKTPPLRDILRGIPDIDTDTYYDDWDPKGHKHERYGDMSELDDFGIPETGGMDPALQTQPAWRTESWTKVQWTGQGGAWPPDPTGAAGQNFYIQAVNSTYRIYQKDGTPETGPKGLGTLWGGASDGDPIVMYDRYAERWFISQFGFTGNKIKIAISETSDPTGAYYLYEFSFTNFPDYPKFAVWSNAYFMSANMSSQQCVAFEREKMLVGDPTASMIPDNFPSHFQFFRSQGIAYAEGATPPEDDEPGWFFAVQENAWTASILTDHIKIFRYDIDWTTGTGNVVTHQDLDTDPFNVIFTASWDDLTQQGTTQKLDALAGIFMYKCQYRRFSDHNTVVLCHTVDVDAANRAAIRWYELREDGDQVWYIYQQGTWSPDGTNSRWMGSIAMDQQGNMALAYSFCGPSEFAGLRYTGRFVGDPLGQMTVQEQIAVEGTGFQTGSNRYGDYAQMTMDPADDMTFWYTGEWLNTTTRRTEIFSFSSWHLVGNEENTQAIPLFNAYQPNPSELILSWRDIADENVTVTLVDISGKLIAKEQLNTVNSTQQSFDVADKASGIYFVTMSGKNTEMNKKIYIGR